MLSICQFLLKGLCQLVKLNHLLVIQLFKKVLPNEWVNGREPVVTWHPGYSDQPPLSWLKVIWGYLGIYDRKLEYVVNLPLFPVDDITTERKSVKMTRVKSDCSLLLTDDHSASRETLDLLEFLGLQLIQKLPDFIQNHPYVGSKHVFPGNPSGIVNLLSVLCSINGTMNVVSRFKCFPFQKIEKEFRSMLSQALMAVGFSGTVRTMLRKFPIFRVAERAEESINTECVEHAGFSGTIKNMFGKSPIFGMAERAVEFVCTEDVQLAVTDQTDLPQVMPKRKVILLSAYDQKLADALGIRRLSTKQLCEEVIIPEICEKKLSLGDLDKTMEYLLPLITSGKIQSSEKLGHLKFVPDKNGCLHMPDDLFDPANYTLVKLFEGENVFPFGFYKQEPHISALRKMGLKTKKNVIAADIFTSISAIEESDNMNKKVTKSQAIAKFLYENPSLLHQKVKTGKGKKLSLKDAISEKVWIKSESQKLSTYPPSLEWYKGAVFHKPSEIYEISQASLIGSLRPVLSVNTYETSLPLELFQKSPDIDDVIHHLKQVAERYTESEKLSFLQVIDKIYAYLQTCKPERVYSVLKRLNMDEWIWYGNGFVSPKHAIISKYRIDLSPYIRVLPEESKKYQNLFISCGMRRECDESLLTEVLVLVKQKHSEGKFKRDENKRDLHLVCQILEEIKETPNVLENSEIYIPVYSNDNNSLKLHPISQCTYSDTERFNDFYDESFGVDKDNNEEGKPMYLVHPAVSKQTAKALCIPSLTSCVLGAESFGVFEACGQGEPLTRRLNRLLEDYKDGFSIPKELIQNADDARATEIRFLYDERENDHCKNHLIDTGMKSCQGPALWAYNDATFSEEDFENITKLSGATKENQSDKIGKFGLGFNTVYNLTDVPSFVSKDRLVIFDPHTTYLGDAIRDKSKPGLKINIGGRIDRLKHFKDQLKPYHDVFGCNMDLSQSMLSFDGTLFRFPLRTKEQSVESEIKSLHYDNNEMKELLQLLVKNGHNLLLFTQNVMMISIYHLPSEAKSPTEMKELATIKREQLHLHRSIPESVLGGSILEVASKAVNNMNFSKQNAAASLKIAEEVAVGMNVTHYGKGRFNLESHCSEKTLWSIHSSIGQSESLDVARNMKGLSPCSSVAIHVSKTEYEYRFHPLHSNAVNGIQGHLFCYLPLPIASGLPVQVNGGFAVNSSRQALQEVSEDDKYPYSKEALWNIALLKDSVTRSYLGALSDLTNRITSTANNNTWYDLWPAFSLSDGSHLKSCSLESLVKSFYEHIVNDGKQWKIFPSNQGWLSWDDIAVLDEEFYCSDLIVDAAIHVLEVFYKDRTILSIPSKLLHTFKETGMDKMLKDATIDIQFFLHEVFFPNIGHPRMKLAERDKLLLFCLENITNGDVRTMLETSECIPTYPHGRMRRPQDLVERNSIVGALYSEEDQVFPMGQGFESLLNLHRLRKLGMSSSQITWENLLERAESVERLSHVSMEMACQRAKKVCELLEVKIKRKEQEEMDSFREKFKSVRFLPVLKRMDSWGTLKWNGGKNRNFLSGKETYPYRLCNLLGCVEAMTDETDAGCGKLKRDVIEFLGMHQNPTVYQVITQFETVINHVNKSKTSDKLNTEKIDTITNDIYKFLNEKVKNKEQIVKQKMSLEEIILVGRQFIDPKYVSFGLPFEASPYLYKLPEKLAFSFSMLMTVFGVKKEFDSKVFIKVLQDIKIKNQGKPLDKKELDIVLNMINMGKIVENSEENLTIYLPDSKGVLCESSELCIHDVTWMPDEDGVRYVHKSISPYTALELGALTRRCSFVLKHSLGIPFGQHEKLTHRLRRIMEGYPCDKGILKELLQNADDACATELHFVLDPREHGKDRLFSEKWEALQGPALLVYNNACFTKEDIKGIQNLGEGSKLMDPARTGQYGVGFNVVYHLTDAPSFLTYVENKGDVLCLFDPQCQYFEGATYLEPGRMFTNARELLSNSFTDVYSGYLPEIFGEGESTIFRLPLRTASMAKDSDISSKVIKPDDIRELMKQFRDEAEEVVLFLNHIKKIRISEVDSRSGKLRDTFCVDVMMSPESTERHENFVKKSKDMANTVKNICNGIQVEQLTNSEMFSYDIRVTTSAGSAQDWNVVQKIGFMDESSISDCVKEHIAKGDLCLLPKGGIALQTPQRCSAKKMKAFCLLPLPLETELPVHVNGHFILDHETRRNLWHDEGTGYKSEWNLSIIKDVIVPCYTFAVMKHAQRIPVKCTVDDVMLNLSKFFQTFPNSAKAKDTYWNELSKSFYQQLVCEHCPVMPVVRQASIKSNGSGKSEELERVLIEWHPPIAEEKAPQFYHVDNILIECNHPRQERDWKKDFSDDKIIKDFLLNIGMNFHVLVPFIVENFQTSEVPLNRLKPDDVLSYISHHAGILRHINSPVQKTVFKSVKLVSLLLRFSLQNCKGPQVLLETPLLVTADEYLRKFENGVSRYSTDFVGLMPSRKDLFVHQLIMTELNRKNFDEEQMNILCREFELQDICSYLPEILPLGLRNQDEPVPWIQTESKNLDKEWLYSLWKFLSRKCVDSRQEDSHEKITKFLEPLSEWCLLPAFRKSDKYESYLVPLQLAYCVLDMTTAAASIGEHMVSILRKIGLLELNYNVLCRSTYTTTSLFAAKVVGQIKDGSSLLKSLHWQYQKDNRAFGRLNIYDAQYLLIHLCPLVSKFSIAEKQMLMELPLFSDKGKNLCSISGKIVYIIPSDVPTEGLQDWSAKENIVLLEESLQMSRVYKNLQLKNCSLVDLYCNIIFVKFEILTPEDTAKHLKFVMWKCLKGEEVPKESKTRILNAMRYLKFLKRGKDFLQAREFYDPDNRVFREMLPSNSFPPAPYSDYSWLDVLRKIGLVQTVSSDMFYKFIGEVSKVKDKEKVKEKSRMLLEHLQDNSQLKEDQHLLNNISNVPFLVSDKVPEKFTEISPPYVSENSLTAFKGTLLSKDWKTSWTICTLLPSYVRSLTKLPFGKLGVRKDLELLEVVHHLINVLDSKLIVSKSDGLKSIHTNSESRTVLIDVIIKCYELISTYDENFSPHALKLLSDATCILVDDERKLAQPSLTTTEGKSIKPYIWNVSFVLGKYFGMFLKLGATKHLSLVQIADVLNKIREESHDSIMDPNKQRCVYKAIFYLVTALQQEQTLASGVLYLPTATTPADGIELMKSTDLLYKDDFKFDQRLKNFAAKFLISKCSFDLKREMNSEIIRMLMEHLPNEHKPKYLSHVVHEKLIQADPTDFHLSNRLIETIQSVEFSEGLARMVKSQSHQKSETVVVDLENLTQLLNNIRITVVKEISTALFYEDKEISGSQMKNEVFVDGSDPSVLKIFISENAKCDVDTCSKIAEYLAKIIGKLFSDKSHIVYLVSLLMKNPEDISAFLDDIGVSRDRDNAKPEDIGRLPLPGEYVPLELHHLLRNEFDDFEEDEYVAFEVEDPSMVGDIGEAIYIYAKVVKKVKEKGPLKSIYRIKVSSNSEKDVCVTELYKFSDPGKILEGSVVPYSGPETEVRCEPILDKPLEEVQEEITNTLEDAWKLPENQRKRVIKRLYLRWHPDKNPPEKEEFCNDVCKYIQAEVQRLQLGLPRRKKESHSSSPRHNPYDRFEDLFSNWNTRARSHFSSRQSYRRSYFGSARSSRSWAPPTFGTRNPQPGEAKRWYQQAKYDFAASSSDFQGPSYEWICFKCHQVRCNEKYFDITDLKSRSGQPRMKL